MDVYGSGTDVIVTVDLIDAQGNVITPDSASYEVFDESGASLTIGVLVVAGNESSLDVTVGAAFNGLVSPAVQGARLVRLAVVSSSGTHQIEKAYVIETPAFLSIPTESGQTELQANMLAVNIPGLDAWETATDRERKSALRVAWERLSRLAYRPWRDYDDSSAVSADNQSLLLGDFRLNELDAAKWAALPAPFVAALKRAQLVEANIALAGDPVWDRRVDGLLSKTVGESSEMFRSGKPVINAVSSKTMRELAGFIDFSLRIGRG